MYYVHVDSDSVVDLIWSLQVLIWAYAYWMHSTEVRLVSSKPTRVAREFCTEFLFCNSFISWPKMKMDNPIQRGKDGIATFKRLLSFCEAGRTEGHYPFIDSFDSYPFRINYWVSTIIMCSDFFLFCC